MNRFFVCGGMIAFLSLGAGALWAEGPKPFPDFSAKRVGTPTAAVGKRITVQIDPDAAQDEEETPAAVALAVPSAPSGSFAWFWDRVSPSRDKAGPGRLQAALDVMAGAERKVPVPRLQQMQDVARANGKEIMLATINTQVSPALVLAVIMVESAGKVDAVSRAGAEGLMQLMPATAERFGVTDSFAARENIRGGVKYLEWLMQEFDRDPILVLAGYNAGEGSVRDHAGVPPFPETRDYVPKVLAAFQVARGLCLTPPELASDGCVFAALD